MSILNTKRFSFKTRFTISEVSFQLQMSSDKIEEDEMIMGRQVITLRTEERGVNMIRKDLVGRNSEFSLTGEGDMDNLGEEELMNFVTRWVMLVQQELMMSLREMEGTKVKEDEGSTVDPSQFWELSSFWTAHVKKFRGPPGGLIF